MYLLESPRRGVSNKYPKHMFSQRITWDCQLKNTRSADFLADRIDVITNFAVITNVVIKRVQYILKWGPVGMTVDFMPQSLRTVIWKVIVFLKKKKKCI